MRPIVTVTDRVAWSVCRSVTIVSPAKTAEPIEMPLEMDLGGYLGYHVLDRMHIGAVCLAIRIEQSVCGGDAALCHITLGAYHLLPSESASRQTCRCDVRLNRMQ